MKELDVSLLFREKTKMEITQRKQQEYQLIYQGTIIPHIGHTLYEVNPKTLEVVEAAFKQRDYVFRWEWRPGDSIPVNSEVVMTPGMVYVSALNKKNALKKFRKGSSGTKIDPTKIYLEL
jgi:hypothetical protein